MTDICVVDLGFGDGGKGATVDWLARQSRDPVVVRFNGGPQALHHVVRADRTFHGFAQFGSGTFAGARTHLSKWMLINPLNWFREDAALRFLEVDTTARVTADPDALVITPYHIMVNRLREWSRGDERHGSCGQGIGEAVAHRQQHPDHALTVRDLGGGTPKLRKQLDRIRQWAEAEIAAMPPDLWSQSDCALRELDRFRGAAAQHDNWIDGYHAFRQAVSMLADNWLARHRGDVIYEGAQGILLDQEYGFEPPHVTWSDTTPTHAMILANEAARPAPETWGVTRTYQTRHGAGPFPTEVTHLRLPELHNGTGEYQGEWRVGWLDLGLLRYSIDLCTDIDKPIDRLAVTHLDRSPGYIVDRRDKYRAVPEPIMLAEDGDEFARLLADALELPLAMTSNGPTAGDKRAFAAIHG